VEASECIEHFFIKMNKVSELKYLVMDNIQPDLNPSLELLGEALAENTKLEILIMRENKIKISTYCNFWDNLKPNSALLKINVSKTELSDKILEHLCGYLQSGACSLIDLDVSRNNITDAGLSLLAVAMVGLRSLKYLNLGLNLIKDEGMPALVNYLADPKCGLTELSLMGNRINNEGVQILSKFLKPNTSLKMLDISKNAFSDSGFSVFA
jgi:Ran GTPase-activating protein (RanGAP) involved in mRNA processing and transport